MLAPRGVARLTRSRRQKIRRKTADLLTPSAPSSIQNTRNATRESDQKRRKCGKTPHRTTLPDGNHENFASITLNFARNISKSLSESDESFDTFRGKNNTLNRNETQLMCGAAPKAHLTPRLPTLNF